MHAALLANTAWLDEELPHYKHLIVGLMDEQVRVVQVVPEGVAIGDLSVFGQRVGWHESRVRWLNRRRIARLGKRIESMGVNLVHALDGRLWRGAEAVSREIGAPLVLTAGSAMDLKLAERLGRRAESQKTAFIATTGPIAEALRQRLPGSFLVELIPPGVHKVSDPCPAVDPGSTVCFVVSGNGKMDVRYQAVLEGIALTVRAHRQTQFFLDGQGADQHEVWQEAKRLNLLGHVSLVPRRLGHRELLLRTDALVLPQPLGKSRSLTLQSMAHGIPILAHDDPWVDSYHQDQTAWVVASPSGADWAGLMKRVIEEPESARRLGERARQWVREHRAPSAHIGRVLELYRRLTGATLAFPEGPAGAGAGAGGG